jgi:cytochrome c553
MTDTTNHPILRLSLLPLASGVIASLLSLLIAGCANPARSRDLGNPAVSAQVLAVQVCSNCHGLSGHSVSPNFPHLAGQVDPYLQAQLKAFKSHNRQDPAGFEYMWGLSRALTDDQIAGLAAYYAAQQPEPPAPPAWTARLQAVFAPAPAQRAEALAAGQSIFDSGVAARNIPACSACHGAKGEGNSGFPRLAGQHADYLVKQLVVFQRTDERPQGSIMKIVAHELTSTDIENVAAYAESLKD